MPETLLKDTWNC